MCILALKHILPVSCSTKSLVLLLICDSSCYELSDSKQLIKHCQRQYVNKRQRTGVIKVPIKVMAVAILEVTLLKDASSYFPSIVVFVYLFQVIKVWGKEPRLLKATDLG